MDAAISLRKAGKRFGAEEVLRGIDLEIGQGEIVAIIGVSGSGKTTLLRLIAGLEVPDAGEILLHGRLVSRAGEVLVPPHERKIGFIFQNLGLWEHLTVEEHLRFVTRDEARLEELLRFLGLLEHRRKKPYQLSGGQRQRLAIARALAQDPDFLLLDEPFSNLDVPRKKQLRREILRIRDEKGLSVVYVTHDPVDVRLLSERTVVLHEGRLVQTGSYEELLRSPEEPIVRELLEV